MNFIDNQRARGGQHLSARLRSEQQVKRLRRGYQNVRRLFGDCLSFRSRRVAGADLRAHINVAPLARAQRRANPGQWFLQIFVNVVAEGLEGRHVNDACLVRERPGQPLAEESVQRRQKRGQGFARTGRRGDQGVSARLDRRPPALLGLGRRSEFLLEPLRHEGMELKQLHRFGQLKSLCGNFSQNLVVS